MRTVELVTEWDSVPFGGGYAGLRTLSDQGFSGAVVAGPTQLFMLNGTVVGVLDGDIEAFEDGDGTARAAPHDALPLLAVMQARADQPRAQYYTEDTSISAVDRTLTDGNFTGYIELSENVLSGDYYLVYHQGRSMSVAWVGSAERLVTDDEAFDAADDEVGIYRVMPADIEPVELPDPPEPSPAAEGTDESVESTTADTAGARTTEGSVESTTADTAGARTTEGSAESTTTDDTAEARTGEPAADERGSRPADGGTAATESTTGATGTASAGADGTDEEPTEAGGAGGPDRSAGPPGSKAAGASQGTAVDSHDRAERDEGTSSPETPDSTAPAETADAATASEVGSADTTAEAEPADISTAEPSDTATNQGASSGTGTAGEPATAESQPAENRTDENRSAESQPAAAATDSDAVGALETRSIPSLDPERSSTAAESATSDVSSRQSVQSQPARTAESGSKATESKPGATESKPEASKTEATESDRAEPATTDDAGQSEPAAQLRAELSDREERIAELERELAQLSTENEELATERDRLRGELEEARGEIRRLEEQLDATGGATTGGRQLSATEAIDGTNLFVRYHSKGEATLAKAQDGSVDRDAVEENLRLEYHTQFDSDEVAVDGAGFEAFLKDSIQYRFVDWLIRGLLYEIRDTGHQSAMGVLYDALPEVDRAELNGSVSVTYTEDGQEHRSQERFDVVVRDRMGNPLVVANINDSREPATEGQMTDIIRNAERVGNVSGSLAAAFLVTNSFFEPEALETAREATSSGLFSRDKRKSFVNLSRKGGYHLCLLEARNREFHLAVPEL